MNALRQQINKGSARADQDRPKRQKGSGVGLAAFRSHSASNFDSKWRLRKKSSADLAVADDAGSRSRAGSHTSAQSAGSELQESEEYGADATPSYSSHASHTSHDSGSSSVSSAPIAESRVESVRQRLASFSFWDSASRTVLSSQPNSREPSTEADRGNDLTDLEPPSAPHASNAPAMTVPFPMLRSRSNYSTHLASGTSEAGSRKSVGSNGQPGAPTMLLDGHVLDSPRARRRTEDSTSRSRSGSLGVNFGFGNKVSSSSVSVARLSSSSDELRWRQELPLPPPPTAVFGALKDPDMINLGLDLAAVRYADHMHMLGYSRNKFVCAILAKESRDGTKFNNMVMQAFILRMMRFKGEPLDMSLRKMLYRVALPQETQQIERVLQAFSALWDYENPGLFADAEQVLFVVFSMVILHTDVFNRNVKHKMPKADYLQYAYTDGLASEILEYFYDNITSTPFREDEDYGTPLAPPSPNSMFLSTSGIDPSPTQTPTDVGLTPSVPSIPNSHDNDNHSIASKRSASLSWARDFHIDPYPYLLENRLDALRPALTSIGGESTCATIFLDNRAQLKAINERFSHPETTIQLISQRSRPDAYIDGSDDAVLEAQSRPGVIQIGIVKHGIVWRREPKKILSVSKPAWKEWGAVLTESRLYLFKSSAYVRLMATSVDGVLRASIDMLNQATTFSTRDLAALTRAHSPPHEDKFEFMLVEGGRDSGHQQWFAVDSQAELTDWVQTINVAATQVTFNIPLVRIPFDALTSPSTESVASRALSPVPSASVLDHIEDVDRQLAAVEDQIIWYLKTFRHLRLLAPIHQRTRETLVFAAGRYSSKCDASLVKQSRLQCYRNVLALMRELVSEASRSRLDLSSIVGPS